MKTLNENWVTEGLIDFEYKKYLLLAYLKQVNACFFQQKLFPTLSDLVFHYRNLKELKERKTLMQKGFPKELKQADLMKARLIYEELIKNNDLMDELESIIAFALPKLEERVEEGKEIYEFYESQMDIEPVGISPVRLDEGYLFVSSEGKKKTKVYEYKVSVFENAKEKFRGIHMDYIQSVYKSISKTYESIKNELIQTRKHLPIPATYLVTSKMACPHTSTMLPIAKRLLIQEIVKYSE